MNEDFNFWNSIEQEWKKLIIVNFELENTLTEHQKKLRSVWLSPFENYKNLIGKEIDELPHRDIFLTSKVDVYGTTISNIQPVSNYLALKEFYCGSTKVSDLGPLTKIISLEKLCCYNTPINDLLPLRNILSLKRLCLSSTKIKSLEPLRSLVNIEKLALYRTEVDNLEPISLLLKLEKININHTKVSSLSPLKNLPNLREVHCYNTLIPIEELIEFRKNKPGCQCVSEYEQPETEYDDFI